ncbi:hypothetical protein BVRB_8g200190 [Beta vulgaris subsp. vulgaris]|uniref:Uncharacterized protein n=1 Tax=Beta vulgaris subsp. vulgaris TaxID=3555 RepID=A0A7G2RMG6_BETVV|nr:protein PHLOEM PROTEIN 2-LIKE A1 [Beta vulgaris subsp. vulgaris]KMS96714.1 hypothetical protein BVRB_8g200190 [Beta vulgaris subsp. vulgaris]
MGTSWSEEQKGSSERQDQPVYHSESDTISSQKSDINTPVPITRNNNNNSHHLNEPKESKRVLLKLPHNCEAIINDNSDSPIDKSSPEKVYEQLHAGVYLNGRRKKYWVDKKGNNCFMVFANDLKITWAENPTYWYLHTAQTSDHGQISVAQLRNVAWLEVHGRFHTKNLSPGVTYQVAFSIMLEYTCYGWELPVNFRLTLPNGSKQEHKENFKEKPKGEWLRIPVGEFKASPENVGEIEFSLYEYQGGSWKKGLVIKSAIIEPKF